MSQNNNNNNLNDYQQILIKTFLNYSWFNPLIQNINIKNNNNNNNINLNNYNYQNKKKKYNNEPRIFPHEIKEKCWNSSKKIPNRDPNRWRYDAIGNPVMKILRGCNGIFCHEYDHIFPYSKGGTSTLDNCQILQTNINRVKGNGYYTKDELKKFNIKFPEKLKELNKNEIGENEMDLMEELIYGNINRH